MRVPQNRAKSWHWFERNFRFSLVMWFWCEEHFACIWNLGFVSVFWYHLCNNLPKWNFLSMPLYVVGLKQTHVNLFVFCVIIFSILYINPWLFGYIHKLPLSQKTGIHASVVTTKRTWIYKNWAIQAGDTCL